MFLAKSSTQHTSNHATTFSGNIFIFHAFDVGDEINLEAVKTSDNVTVRPLTLPKYFKHYHTPIAVELPHPHATSNCISVRLHNFGAISLTYKVPFEDTLEGIRESLQDLDNKFQEQSVADANTVYRKVEPYITKANFFDAKSSYLVIQVDPQKGIDGKTLKEDYSGIIASALRFETETLSEYKKNEILSSSIGYFKGDLIVIDTSSAFVYDPEYEEILDFFAFANLQQLELHYFDQVLDNQLNVIYEDKGGKIPLKSFLPFIGTLSTGPIDELGKLRVDISVITEQLESSIKLVGEPYFSELYSLLQEKLDLDNWKQTIDKKLAIIHDIRSVWQHKVDSIREDMLTVLIIILIMTELVIGVIR